MPNVTVREAFITSFVRENKEKIHKILSSTDLDIIEKATLLRRMARQVAEAQGAAMQYENLADFETHYDRGNTPLTRLEGEGFRKGELFVLKNCPMSPVFGEFKVNGDFPGYWTSVVEEYMKRFQNDAMLHPLCIVHQTFRDILTSKIPKGTGFVHSVTVSCRSMSSGKMVHNEYGLKIAGREKAAVEEILDGFACCFYAK